VDAAVPAFSTTTKMSCSLIHPNRHHKRNKKSRYFSNCEIPSMDTPSYTIRSLSQLTRLIPRTTTTATTLFSSYQSYNNKGPPQISSSLQRQTLFRIGIPSIVSGLLATCAFPFVSFHLASLLQDRSVFHVLATDASAYVQNFLSVTGLLYGLILGETFSFVYAQQEAVFYALFEEVTETKSLVEQIALICQGRGQLYGKLLQTLQQYIESDLKQMTMVDPAVQISTKPIDDPLESIMYMTSVGVPSVVYQTVKSLRKARAARLGALQRKVPPIHMALLWILASTVLVTFPLLGAAMSTATLHNRSIMTVEGCLFGILVWSVVMTKRVTRELWKSKGGAYNTDAVLGIMVRGLEEELHKRIRMVSSPPSPPSSSFPSQ